MCKKLENLAQDFVQYRGNRKRTKYPKSFWDRAAELCKHHSIIKVAETLEISRYTLHRHLNSRKIEKNSSPFIPIQIAEPSPSLQIQIGGTCPITIDFCRSTEELAKLLLAIQGVLSC